MPILSQTSICHRIVFLQQKPVTKKCFCNRNQLQNEVSVTLDKNFPCFAMNQMKKFTHSHRTFHKNEHEIMEENYFVEPCLANKLNTLFKRTKKSLLE